MGIPYLDRQAKKRIGDDGRKSERTLSKSIGGKLRPASGAKLGAKGDIEVGNFLMEAKSTINDSLSIKSDWLRKIAKEARQEGKTGALAITFTKADGSPYPDCQWVAIPLSKWKELTT